jgi:hypothetical protein
MDEAAEPRSDDLAPSDPRLALPEETGVAWIHSLAGEWLSRQERAQNPQALSGASLRK